MEKLGHSWVMGLTGWFGPTGCSRMSAQRTQSGELRRGKGERCRSTSERGEGRGLSRQPGREGRDTPRGKVPEAGLRPLPAAARASSCAGIQLCGQSDVQGSRCAGSYLCMVPAVQECSCVQAPAMLSLQLCGDPAVLSLQLGRAPAVICSSCAWGPRCAPSTSTQSQLCISPAVRSLGCM